MRSAQEIAFLGGMIAMGYVVAGLFFFRFWRRTRDALFVVFSLAFCLMGANQALVTLTAGEEENKGELYLMRLLAFVLIVVGVLRKNFEKPR
ncbi:MAG: hypothetical protein JSR45_17365 [Proteobacteria bacterium]|nr:hypothetical protein [Pseudomonadota bacterium]